MMARQKAAAGGEYPAAVLEDAPSFYWRLGETSGSTAADESGNAHDGTYVNTPTLGVAGAVPGDTAVAFDGATEYVSLDYPAMMPAGGLSIEFWFKHTSTSLMASCGDFNAGSTEGVQVEFNSTDGGVGNVRCWLRSGSGAFNVKNTTGLTLNDGGWHHFVYTTDYIAANGYIYIDGSDATGSRTGADLGAFADWQFDWLIGARNNRGTADEFYAGSLDEYAFYPHELSPARVAAHYAAASA